MNKDYILGIDTSAYTTSVSLIDLKGNILYDFRKKLNVPKGSIGLRQQEAVFQHLGNIPEILCKLDINFNKIDTISVSSKPRNVNNSYMPVFMVGKNYGQVLSKACNAKLIEYSHQEGHVSAALIDYYKVIENPFLAIHISGGTTEFLLTKKVRKGFESKILGGTKDITFGQLIDRIGVFMEFPFPAGVKMEEYINEKNNIIKMPKISGNSYINLSGIENYLKDKYINKKYTNEEIISSLFDYIKNCIIHIIKEIKKDYCFNSIVITGGVSSNNYLRYNIEKQHSKDFNIIFPKIGYSTDNAIGNSFLPIMDRWFSEIKSN